MNYQEVHQLIQKGESLTVEFKENFVIISIKGSSIKPVSVKGRCFKRVGNINRVMSASEVAELHLSSTGKSWDKTVARDVTIKDISLESVNKYSRKVTRERETHGSD